MGYYEWEAGLASSFSYTISFFFKFKGFEKFTNPRFVDSKLGYELGLVIGLEVQPYG